MFIVFHISIHALRMERDGSTAHAKTTRGIISIHALRMERDDILRHND